MAEKKPADTEDDDDDLDDEPAPEAAGEAEHDDMPDLADDDDAPVGGGKGKLIAIIAVALTLFIAAAGATYFFVFHDSGGEETAAVAPPSADDDGGTSMTISRNRRVMTSEELAKQGSVEAPAASGGLTPPAPASGAGTSGAAPAADTAATQATPPAQAPAPALQAPAPQAAVQAPAKGAKGKGAPAPARITPDTPGLVTPAATAAAYRDIPVLPAGKPLSAPDPSYGETVDGGIIPRARGSLGIWKAYARPFDGPVDKPRVAIIITGLGLSRASTLAAISQTPANITLAFDPYTRNLDEWLGLGRSNGHEALMQLPMEPIDFPVSDPGPLAMLTDLEPAQNIARLHQIFASAIGYTGVIQVMGSKFAASEAALRPTLEELKKRGVMFVNVPSGTDDHAYDLAQQIGVPAMRVDVKLDGDLTSAAIDNKIAEMERIAHDKGRAIAVAEAYPLTLARLALWGQSLSLKDLTLAPASAMAQVGAPAAPAAKGAAPKH